MPRRSAMWTFNHTSFLWITQVEVINTAPEEGSDWCHVRLAADASAEGLVPMLSLSPCPLAVQQARHQRRRSELSGLPTGQRRSSTLGKNTITGFPWFALVRTERAISFHGSIRSPVGVVFYQSNIHFPRNTVYRSADYSCMLSKWFRNDCECL